MISSPPSPFARLVVTALSLAIGVASQASPSGANDDAPPAATRLLGEPITDAVTEAHLMSLLRLGDEAMVIQAFRRHPGRVLSFIDAYLERGLAIVEKSTAESGDADPSAAEAMASYKLALRFAALADRAFGETIFTEYAAGFAGWSPAEQRRFREGQRLYREARGLDSEDPQGAFDRYRRSLTLAESIGDHWGMAMAYRGIAESGARVEQMDVALDSAIKAVSLTGRLQLREQHARSMMTAGRLQATMEMPGAGVQYFLLARQLLPTEADPALRKEIVKTLFEALELAGRTADLQRIKAEEARRSALIGE